VSEPAEPLAEPFELLAGPAMPHVDLVASALPPVVPEPDDEGPVVGDLAIPSVEPPVAAIAARPQSQRRPAAGVISGRGVTGRGIVVLILFVTGIVGLIEVALAGHRGHGFAIAFVVASAVGALVVRRRDLPTAMISPPLLYCVLIVAMSAVDKNDETGGFLTREGVYVGNAFVTGAPAVWAGTGAAVLIGWYRYRASAPRAG